MVAERALEFAAPVHRALTEPMLLAGAPRAIALVNGTLAAALGVGLRLWAVGIGVWLVGQGTSQTSSCSRASGWPGPSQPGTPRAG